MASTNIYVVIGRSDRKRRGYGTYATKHAATSQARHCTRKGDAAFVVAIPRAEFAGYSAAYVRQHGTAANPR